MIDEEKLLKLFDYWCKKLRETIKICDFSYQEKGYGTKLMSIKL